MAAFKLPIILTVFSLIAYTKPEDSFYTVNTKKPLHRVSEKFLSVSIDPAVLLAGVNLSDSSFTLAKHLSPAYIRLAGPSTKFVKYVDNEDEAKILNDKGDLIYVTPSMWFGINEWFSLADLTPVFGLNDRNTVKGVWNPNNTIPLFEMSDKFGVTCYWQLGSDCINKTIIQYVDDLHILKQTLRGFPAHKESWKVVGSDFSTCNFDDAHSNGLENYIRDLDGTADANYSSENVNCRITVPKGRLGFDQAELWTTVPKEDYPVTFGSAIRWARKVGEAAALGYDVVFREPRLLEITLDTPVYWFSLLHKNLMGTQVLEVKQLNANSDLFVFAHCTKSLNNLAQPGAVTVLVVNGGPTVSNINLRLGGVLLEKTTDIYSYILSAPTKSSNKVFLNGIPLSMELLQKSATDKILQPELKSAKLWPHIALEVPEHTLAFFVLNGAKSSLCSNKEVNPLSDKNNQDTKLLTQRSSFSIGPRFQSKQSKYGDKNALQNLKNKMLKEVEVDRSYYDTILKRPAPSVDLMEHVSEEDHKHKWNKLHKHLKTYIKDSPKGQTDHSEKPTGNNLQLTIKEIEHILKQRAKARAAAKNIKLTSAELDMLVDKATLKIPKYFVSKRDINHNLLEEKAIFHSNNMFSQETYEQLAKEKKFKTFSLPTISKKHFGRRRRSINTHLLNLKAMLEENEKYLKDHRKGTSRVKRDINLDLVKQRSQTKLKPFGRANVNNGQRFWFRNEEPQSTLELDGDSTDEIFDDLMRFEEKSFNEFLNSEEMENQKRLKFKNAQSKVVTNPFWNKASKTRNWLNSLKSVDDDDLQMLRTSSEEYSDRDWKEKKKLSIFGKSRKGAGADAWDFKVGKAINSKKVPEWLCEEFGDLHFSDELDRERRKRDTTKEDRLKLQALKTKLKNLKQQIKEEKRKYLTEKLKNNKKRRDKSNIEIIPTVTPAIGSKNIIDQANSEENMIVTSQEKMIQLRPRRFVDTHSINLEENEIDDGNSIVKGGRNIDDLEWKEKNYYTKDLKEKFKKVEKEMYTVKPIEPVRTTGNNTKPFVDPSLTYLQKVLGSSKAKYIEKFVGQIQETLSEFGSKVKQFFSKIL